LVEEFPDSAALYLDSIVSLEKMKVRDQHLYQLLSVQIKDKRRERITGDTIICTLKGIYDKSDPAMASAIYYYSALVYEEQGKYNEAMQECLKAEKLSDLSTEKHKGLIQNAIGRMFLMQASTEKAREYFEESLNYFQKLEDINNILVVYTQIGLSYLVDNDIDIAFSYCEKCIEIMNSFNNFSPKVSIILDLSLIYRMIGDYDNARLYLEKTLTLPINQLDMAKIKLNFAKISIHDSDLMYSYVNEALMLAKEENDLLLLSNIHNFISSFEEENGKLLSALDNYKKHTFYIREYLEVNFAESLLDMQHQFQLTELQNKNMDLTIKHQRIFIIVLLIITLLIGSWIYMFRQKKIIIQAERDIERLQKMSISYNEKETTLKSIVLKDFDILKKVALLENYMIHNETNSRLIKKFNEIVYNQESMDWERLYETMNGLYNNLFTKLKSSFPQLDESEFKICCLSIAKFSNAEIALIMKYSTSSIQWKKACIRKKLGVNRWVIFLIF